MVKKIMIVSLLQRFNSPRNLGVLWSLIAVLTVLYFLLMHYRPAYKAREYYVSIATRMVDLKKGGLSFFLEKQRRTIFELSRSIYMKNFITFTQGQLEVTEQQILKMESFMKMYKDHFGYKQMLLLDKEGTFVFSTMPELRRKSIHDEAYKDSSIVSSFELVSMTLTSDISSFRYDPVVQQKAIFITMPVFFNEALNGYLVIQIDDKEVERLIAQAVDLGVTGEYLIVQHIRDRITFILAPLAESATTLPVLLGITSSSGSPVERSALGYEGYGITLDHRDTPVVAAWYFLPQLNWGFVCKTDYAEIVRPVHRLGYIALFLLLCALVLTVLYFLSLNKNDHNNPLSPPTILP